MEHKLNRAISKLGHDLALTDLKKAHDSRQYHNLSYQDVLYLNMIECHPNKYTSSQIADLLQITRPAVTQKINILVEKGYVIRTQSPSDKRVHYLSVNLESDYFSDVTYEEVDMIQREFVREYGEEKLDLFCEMLDFISEKYEITFEKKE